MNNVVCIQTSERPTQYMYPTEVTVVSYRCQYAVTNIGSSNVIATVDGDDTPSIDPRTIEASGSSTFLLDYDVATGTCPNVTVTAASKDCGTTPISWPPTNPTKSK